MPIPADPSAVQQQRILALTRLFIMGVTVVMLTLLGRVIQLQHRPTLPIEQKVAQRGSDSRLIARRGALVDTRGRPLAVTRLGVRLFVDPQLIEDPLGFSFHVAHAVGDDPARIDRLIDRRSEGQYAVVNPLLDEDQVEAVRGLDLAGLATEPVAVRHYPQGATAGQVIGFVGTEHKGLDGIEFALESVLGGEPGSIRTLRDARRRPLWIEQATYRPPTDGHSVRLSIDTVVQQIAEDELAAACEEYQADRGEVVVMDARNGQLLAMANWPPLDPRDPAMADVADRRNRCVTDPYEPGSVFKPFIHAVATEQGLARPETMVDCTEAGYWVSPKGRRLRDAHGHGTISWDEVLIVSSNIGMAKVAGPMGAKKMYETLHAFGFGERTGTALPGESPGIVNPLPDWTHYSLSSIPMGQEVAVTPVQMVRAFSVFANGGLMASPSILADEADTPLYQRVLDKETADHTRKIMHQVVTEGTGHRANSEQYRIWGKTGTAQIPDRVRGGYKPRAYTASFIGGAPLVDPRIIVLCTVHEPSPKIGYYGGVVAAPVVKNVVEQTLPYLGVAPDGEGMFEGEANMAAAE